MSKKIVVTDKVMDGKYLERIKVERVCEIFCEDLENYFNGRPLKQAVELSVGY